MNEPVEKRAPPQTRDPMLGGLTMLDFKPRNFERWRSWIFGLKDYAEANRKYELTEALFRWDLEDP